MKSESLSCASEKRLQRCKKHMLKYIKVTHLSWLSGVPKSLKKKWQMVVNGKKLYYYKMILRHWFIARAIKKMGH